MSVGKKYVGAQWKGGELGRGGGRRDRVKGGGGDGERGGGDRERERECVCEIERERERGPVQTLTAHLPLLHNRNSIKILSDLLSIWAAVCVTFHSARVCC